MGLETIAIIGLTALKVSQQMETAKENAKAINANAAMQAETLAANAAAISKEGSLAAKNKAQQVALKAASQQSSFLNSGLTLEGTPMAVIQGTFDTGLEDVNQILENYGTQSKNLTRQATNTLKVGQSQANSAYSSGRAEALGTLAGSVSGMSFGNFADNASFGFNTGGQTGFAGVENAINANRGYYGPGF